MRFAIVILFILFALINYAQDTIVLKEITVEDKLKSTIHKNAIDSLKQDRYNQQSLGDLLNREPGIIIKNQGNGGIQTISIMGTHNQHSQVIWYGMPINESLNGQVDYSQLTNNLLSNTSIYYGISSMQESSGAMGGLIYIENKKIDSIKPNTNLYLRFESLKNQIYYLDNTTKFRNSITSNSIRFAKGNQEFSFKNIALLPASTCTNRTPFRSLSYQNNSSFRWKHTQYHLMVELSNNNRNFAPLMTSYFMAEHEENQDIKGIKAVLKGIKEILNWNVEILAGFNYNEMNYILQHTINNNLVSAIRSLSKEQSYFYSIHGNKKITGKLWYNGSMNLSQEYGQFIDLNNQIGFCKVRYQSNFNQSFQLFWAKHFKQQILLNTQYVRHQINFLPAMISKFTFTKNLLLFYSIGINQRIPSLNELYYLPGGNKSLIPEKSFQHDITLNYKYLTQAHNQYFITIKPYYNRIKNWILWTPGQFGYWEANNVRQVILMGSMLQAKAHFNINKNNQFAVDFNYTYQIIDGNDCEYKIKHNPYIPSHLFNANLDYTYKQMSLYSEVQFASTRYSHTYEDAFALEPYTIYNFGVNYSTRTSPSFAIDFKVNNLTDVFYQSVIWRAMPGRYFELSLKCSL